MAFQVQVTQDLAFPIIQLSDLASGAQSIIYSKGGFLNSWIIADHNFIDGFRSPEASMHEITNSFAGSKLSPFVCRLNKGEYLFEGKKKKIEKFYLDGHALHGLLYDCLFQIIDYKADQEQANVTLAYQYNGADAGYPFPYTITINWKLTQQNKLSVTTTLEHHHHTSIPISDGWHPYFTLSPDIDDCNLSFNARQQIAFNEALLPTGEIIETSDFITPKSLKGVQLDNCFLYDAKNGNYCQLEHKQFILTILPDHHYPYLQIYTPSHRRSIAIENLTSAPDAFNNGLGLILLEPDKQLSMTTTYRVQIR